MTCPTSPSARISRVAEMFSARRNKVVISSSEGNVEKLKGLSMSKVTSNTNSATEKLVSSNRSSNQVGIGVNSTSKMPMMATANSRSLLSDSARVQNGFMGSAPCCPAEQSPSDRHVPHRSV